MRAPSAQQARFASSRVVCEAHLASLQPPSGLAANAASRRQGFGGVRHRIWALEPGVARAGARLDPPEWRPRHATVLGAPSVCARKASSCSAHVRIAPASSA